MAYVAVFAVVVWIGSLILFLRSIRKTLTLIPDEHRKMEPDAVWISLIPFFSLYWSFHMLFRLRDSFESMVDAGHLKERISFGYFAGLMCAITAVVMMVVRVLGRFLRNNTDLNSIALLSAAVGLILLAVYVVTWGVHWWQLVAARKQLSVLVPVSAKQ
jgi:hypothetical protein